MNRNSVAAKVREDKEHRPERYCAVKECLWRLKDSVPYCPRHAATHAPKETQPMRRE